MLCQTFVRLSISSQTSASEKLINKVDQRAFIKDASGCAVTSVTRNALAEPCT